MPNSTRQPFNPDGMADFYNVVFDEALAVFKEEPWLTNGEESPIPAELVNDVRKTVNSIILVKGS